MTASTRPLVRLSYAVARSEIQVQRLNGYKTMKTRKKKIDGLGEAASSRVEYHTVNCCGCGKFIKKIKVQKKTVKESFECPSCTSRFSLTFPGTNADVDPWS